MCIFSHIKVSFGLQLKTVRFDLTCCAESKSRLYVSYRSCKKPLQLPTDTVYEIVYTRVGISPSFYWESGRKIPFVLWWEFNLCANVLWVSCEWEPKHGEEERMLYQSISHFWCFSAAHIWWNNTKWEWRGKLNKTSSSQKYIATGTGLQEGLRKRVTSMGLKVCR